MAKKKMSQNNSEKSENSEQESSNNISIDNSTNKNKSERKSYNSKKDKYIFSTPFKRIKFNKYILMAPKKKKITLDYDSFHIKGKNLLNIFNSM